MSDVTEKAKMIRLMIFDVDGVLTDSNLYFGDNGVEYKTFNSKDGLGMRLLHNTGVEIGIITGRQSQSVQRRMDNLGIKHVYQGQSDKLPVYEQLKSKLGLTDEEIAYAGDDFPDLPIMGRVGLSFSVADAHHKVRTLADYTTVAPGGKGAAREICDLIMQAQGRFNVVFDAYADAFVH